MRKRSGLSHRRYRYYNSHREPRFRYYQLALVRDPGFAAARIYLERTQKEIECVYHYMNRRRYQLHSQARFRRSSR